MFLSQVFVREAETVENYSNNVTVEVRVEDRNDNSPRFVKPFYEVTVKEELPRGTPILQVLKVVLFTWASFQFIPRGCYVIA